MKIKKNSVDEKNNLLNAIFSSKNSANSRDLRKLMNSENTDTNRTMKKQSSQRSDCLQNFNSFRRIMSHFEL
jgi:hypothetical protein